MKENKLTVAELQAKHKELAQDITVLKTRTDDVGKQSLELKEAQLEACDANIALTEQSDRNSAALAAKAKSAIDAMTASGAVAPQNTARIAELTAMFTDPTHGEAAIASYAGPALQAGGASGRQAGARW